MKEDSEHSEPGNNDLGLVKDIPRVEARDIHRERSAREIAHHLVTTFRYSLWGALAAGCIVCLIGAIAEGRWGMGPIVKEAVVPFLQAVGTFATTVFGPLLAFILGYYFGEKRNH